MGVAAADSQPRPGTTSPSGLLKCVRPAAMRRNDKQLNRLHDPTAKAGNARDHQYGSPTHSDTATCDGSLRMIWGFPS